MLKVHIETLGCPKNQIDSEMMLGLLSRDQYGIAEFPEEADVIIINTCGFIESAKEESVLTITEFLELKNEGKCSTFIVAGCLVERYAEELKKELPEVDIFIGTTKFPLIVQAIESHEQGHDPIVNIGDIDILIPENIPRIKTTPDYTSYLKISEGCDNNCTYCIIPQLRGKYRSRHFEDIIAEAKTLVSDGAKELIIIAQDTIRYGKDIYGKNRLAELLSEICKIKGLKWVRLMYAYPDEITQELVDTFAEEEKLINYIDMPIQHASNTVLKRMNRRTSKEEIRHVVEMFRNKIPEMVIRTTLIVGFPGETEEEYNELFDFVKEIKFGRLGVFSYSQQDGTPAAKMKDQVDEDIKEERKNFILELQQGISLDNNAKYMDQIIEVLVEEQVDDEDVYMGRASFDAPEIDGQVYINTKEKLIIGSIVKVEINDYMEYDLIGGLK
ncbi:MAG: 30S ribosomal protein S12 methylthiotransferase RimO [Clostridiales bacterium]|nr:30S ribosomal protein S12 methylthiotransferase RimO [Clostridiales bacterium]